MRYQAFVRAAATVLSTALLGGTALAQTAPVPQPETMSDIAPLPPSERSSAGAIILMEEPVLAQRELLRQAQERTEVDTRSMGAGPAALIEQVFTEEELRSQREQDAAKRLKKLEPK